MRNKFHDAIFEIEFLFLTSAFVEQRDREARVQKRELAETVGQNIKFVLDRFVFENFAVGLEGGGGAMLVGFAGLGDCAFGNSLGELHGPHKTITANHDLAARGQCIHDGSTYAVQTTGNFVAVVIKFSASVQNRHHDFERRLAVFVFVDRNSTAVI